MKSLPTFIALALFAVAANTQAADLSGLSTSNATTNAMSGASNQGVNTTFNSTGSRLPQFTMALTTAMNYAAAPASSYAQASCAGGESHAVTVGPIGYSSATPLDGHECNGLLNGEHLARMANEARARGNAALEAAKAANVLHDNSRTETFSTVANRLYKLADGYDNAHRNLECRQDATMYAVMAHEGLCESIDYDGYKKEFEAPTANAAGIPRGNAQASLPGVDGSLGG